MNPLQPDLVRIESQGLEVKIGEEGGAMSWTVFRIN